SILATVIYFTAMVITGIVEEILFRGLLFKAMSKSNIKSAIIVTSITFGIGHIVNLVNGNNADYVETICQIFYAVTIGFLLAAVLYVGESLIPCIITHSMLNALSSFSSEAVIDNLQIPVSVTLCVISVASAVLIFRNAKRE
ncbi:MAG: CPBP family intramembrane metalloprotease, partial [Eubacteriales bacterium]|nr:CPBP family intramembrane metalloprotease [Eubacteriales bacterium]